MYVKWLQTIISRLQLAKWADDFFNRLVEHWSLIIKTYLTSVATA